MNLSKATETNTSTHDIKEEPSLDITPENEDENDDFSVDQTNNCKDKSDGQPTSKSKLSQGIESMPATSITSSSATTPSNDDITTASKFSMYNINEELLGSVTTLSSPAVRTSARVIQKMKMDSIRPASPPIVEKKETPKDERPQQKTPSQPKPNKVTWTNSERNLFFEAINEYGKDFDAIGHYINNKQKRKNVTDPAYKTKDNVRQLYHQTFHKVSKFLRFSDDVKKLAQELYAIINFGEMRKKLMFINQKDCMKLKELVYKGSVKMRVKGKNVLIKTPSCKALRKLNQLEEWQEEIKLPSKVDVFLKPANIDSWSRVQNLSQNPRIKTILPLQKRVLSLLKTLQIRWRSRVARLCEQTMTISTSLPNQTKSEPSVSSHQSSAAAAKQPIDGQQQQQTTNDPIPIVQDFEPLLCFAPPVNTVIHRPMVNLSEFMSSYSICLNSYEDRIGVSTKGERLCTERLNTLKESFRANSKRQRNDSGSEKKTSPDSKRLKIEAAAAAAAAASTSAKVNCPSSDASSADDQVVLPMMSPPYTNLKSNGSIEIDGITKIGQVQQLNEMHTETTAALDTTKQIKVETVEANSNDDFEIKQEPVIIPLSNGGGTSDLSATAITSIIPSTSTSVNAKPPAVKRKDANKCNTATGTARKKEPFRALLSEEVVQQIKKGWTVMDVGDLTIGDLYIMFGQEFKVNLVYNWNEQNIKMEQSSVSSSQSISSSDINVSKPTVTNDGGKLELAPAPPSLGTSVELGNKLKQLLMLASMQEKVKPKKNNCACDRGYNKLKNNDEVLPDARSFISNKIYPPLQTDNGLFRQPVLPLREGLSHIQAYKLNLNSVRNKQQSRWMRMRNSRQSNQVVVQRLLPLQPGVSNAYGLVTTQEEFLKSTLRTNGNSSANGGGQIEPPPLSSIKKVFHTPPTEAKKTFTKNNNNNNNVEKAKSSADNKKAKSEEIETPTPSKLADEIDAIVENENSLSDDPGLKSLLEISLPSPVMTNHHEEEFIYGSHPPMSPMGIIRESPTDPKWYEDNINDFSLSSFLGQLESTCETPEKNRHPRDVDSSSNLSALSESSIDYMSKFVELTQSMKNEQ